MVAAAVLAALVEIVLDVRVSTLLQSAYRLQLSIPMIAFTNPDLIDLRAVRTFGLNAKEGDSPIGFFGTGLKYAIAVLLRTGHAITLYRGLDKHTFSTRQIDSRGKGFALAFMDDMELPFTLELGKAWQVWQAYRELHSNALDEKGSTHQCASFEPTEGRTSIVVSGPEIETTHAQRDAIFLSSAPIHVAEAVQIHPGRSNHGYYRGIRVRDLKAPSLFTYNLTHLLNGLTEDRTLKSESDLDYYVAHALVKSEDEAFLEAVITAPKGTFEHDLLCYASSASEAFFRVYSRVRLSGRITELTAFANTLYLRVRKTLPLPPAIKLSRMQEKQLHRAVEFCVAAGWSIRDYPIEVIPHAHGGLLALAEDGKIILTERLFDQGVKPIVSALLEEWTHLKLGLQDETRALQTHLFDQLVSAKQEMLQEVL